MALSKSLVNVTIKHYKLVIWILLIATVGCGAWIWRIKVDTDPENMLPKSDPARIFHNQTKEDFFLHDLIVIGVINEEHPQGVFNVGTLERVYHLIDYAKDLQWEDQNDPQKMQGVIASDIIAPSTVDHISSAGSGEVRFEWLMGSPPTNPQEALQVRERLMANPLLQDTVVSKDGKALALYLPISKKNISWQVSHELKSYIAKHSGDEEYYITGLPVAEDTFGVEMFYQMAISAPLAMAVIFFLLWLFFRKLVLILSPMIIALTTVIITMGAMIGLGYPVHIMSSMIPIFLMPISVVDSVHILSEFFDLYDEKEGRRKTIKKVISNLFVPMLYTSLTSAAGFASLALAPIPPVQVFGIFVALGVIIAWITTIMFIPAYVMIIPAKSLKNFGRHQHEHQTSKLGGVLKKLAPLTYRWSKLIILFLVLISSVAVYGISKIRVNDNPIKWFVKSHPIRQADIKLNKHFGGTYMAYLVVEASPAGGDVLSENSRKMLRQNIEDKIQQLKSSYPKASMPTAKFLKLPEARIWKEASFSQLLDKLSQKALQYARQASDDPTFYAWDEVAYYLETYQDRLQPEPPFKQPEVLRYISKLEHHLVDKKMVGKSNSIADIVKKVHQELQDGSQTYYTIPDTSGAVADTLFQYQNSHSPRDLWHMVNYDYNRANIWFQLTSGDNYNMEKITEEVDRFFKKYPPPDAVKIDYRWAGLTYINMVWQNKMVWGMLQSFLGSFVIVFIMMTILFRSALWGLLCMLPLTVTIIVIYGIIGLIGKDYDMPVAVLSALTLGMSVDFAIHFLQRTRSLYKESNGWQAAVRKVFGEPARAITKNALIISIGFLPLLAAPLVPYKTVGILICSIMALSALVTLLALPAVITLARKGFLGKISQPRRSSCSCLLCGMIALSAVILLGISLHQYWQLSLSLLVFAAAVFLGVIVLTCIFLSRRSTCQETSEDKDQSEKNKE
ncbi:MAG: efflux RND transporter permease subunit [Chlamydiota bacterium]